MQTLAFERQLLGRVDIDFCFPCQVIWFDQYESLQLAPGGVLEVFKALHERRAPTRNAVPELLDCPRCHARLALTHDVQRSTHFSYYRCTWGHGRLTPFFQFLREKNFVRPVTGAELAALKAKIRTVQCSNCGAPVDLEHDTACPYCRSPIAILDPDAVTKALRELSEANTQRHSIDIDRLVDALARHPPPTDDALGVLGGVSGGDLVAAGIGAIAAAFLLSRS